VPIGILCPPKRRFWMCRADGGKYRRHFTEHTCIALGHVDSLQLNVKTSREESAIAIERFFEKQKVKTATATNHLHQILHFIYDARIGDIVVTPDANSIYLGRILSDARYDKGELSIKVGKGDRARDIRMGHYLRRKVKWITRVSRAELPYALSKGIGSHQAFFCLDQYEAQIYATICPHLYKDDALTTNLLIKKKGKISTYQFSKLTSLFLKTEFIANCLVEIGTLKSTKEIQSLFERYCVSGNLTSALIAEFSSPGRTSNQTVIPFLGAALIVQLLTNALTGGEVEIPLLRIQTNGLVRQEAVERFLENVTDQTLQLLREWMKEDAAEAKRQLELKLPGNEVELAELEVV
jgi:hypothetical protein